MNKDRLLQIAAMIENSDPGKAAEIRKAVADFEGGRREGLNISVGIRYRLEKFDGEFVPGKTPVETIEGADILS